MSTRSAIGIMHGDKIKAIYCHSDGYLRYNGKVLLKHYGPDQSPKVNHLISMGDMSNLGKEIGEKIDFDDRMSYTEDRIATQCRFYGRDRGDTDTEFGNYHTDQELFDGVDAEYFYLLKDGAWYVSKGKEWTLLADAIKNIDNY